ncbi:hypothetical protein Ddye_018008 [Dipteronia dyeriana]|uniref:Phytocyanin domain-containing protein n=1 Tax=Dipteronia dyeriana TaxID=168575 RepID=A0AAD9X0C3_9ROSI|nr:hypothetical protein Ddye_018008 [Dipteronia dyeriana]
MIIQYRPTPTASKLFLALSLSLYLYIYRVVDSNQNPNSIFLCNNNSSDILHWLSILQSCASFLARKMAVQRTLICLAATTALLMQLAMAATYTVGGPNGGWDVTTDLQTWAASQSFIVGDNLNFQYTTNHDVLEVTKANYDACTTSNAVQSYNGGNTVITLSSPGKRYFICGTAGHCSQGMKVEIDTLATSSPPPATPSTPPPTSPTTPPPQASPSTPPPSSPTTPPPKASPSTPTPVSSSAPETSSPSPAQSPKKAPKMAPSSPSSSPSSSPPLANVPSTDSPTTASPPGSSSATKGVSKTTVTLGLSLGMLMLLAL